MGEGYRPLIDHDHFMGHGSFDFPRHHHTPLANIAKHEKKLVLDVLVPGFTKDDLEVSIKGDVLTVRGRKPQRVEETGVEYVMEEFAFDAFERNFKLSKEVSTDEMEAKCENGVLHISFLDDKGKEYKRVHKIEVD
jgi:HSP20 family protein